MRENLAERFAELPVLLGGHLLISISAVLVGVLVSVPLGIWASRSSRVGGLVLGVTSLAQTIPSMALLALMVPLLGGTIGFLPAFLALTLYSLLPTLRNTLTGIDGVAPDLIEAARGVGMTQVQRLVQVELPLALPVIVAGIRTAVVWVVGTATLATLVGARSLGNYIFAGLQTRNWVSVLFGCFFAALLALTLDQLIRLFQRATEVRSRGLALVSLVGLMSLVLLGSWPFLAALGKVEGPSNLDVLGSSSRPGAGAIDLAPLQGVSLTIGSKAFTEQYVLAEFLGRHLQAQGAQIERVESMGSTILFDALSNGSVDLYVDYTGTLWTTILQRQDPIGRTSMFIEIAKFLLDQYGILTVGRLGFENAYCFAVSRDTAVQLGLSTISDLLPEAPRLSIAGDPEFFARPEWRRVRQLYGLDAISTRGMDATFMYTAVRDGSVDVIGAYTTDGRIKAFDLAVLSDPLQAFPPYDAVLLASPQVAKQPAIVAALRPLLNRIDDALMREANRLVDLEGHSPSQAANFLMRQIRGRSEATAQ